MHGAADDAAACQTLASLASLDTDRWLPIFWAIDQFKASQAANAREADWTMGAVDESAVPPSDYAKNAFIAAMDNWDESAADAAEQSVSRAPAESTSCSRFSADTGHAIFATSGTRLSTWPTFQVDAIMRQKPMSRENRSREPEGLLELTTPVSYQEVNGASAKPASTPNRGPSKAWQGRKIFQRIEAARQLEPS